MTDVAVHVIDPKQVNLDDSKFTMLEGGTMYVELFIGGLELTLFVRENTAEAVFNVLEKVVLQGRELLKEKS